MFYHAVGQHGDPNSGQGIPKGEGAPCGIRFTRQCRDPEGTGG